MKNRLITLVFCFIITTLFSKKHEPPQPEFSKEKSNSVDTLYRKRDGYAIQIIRTKRLYEREEVTKLIPGNSGTHSTISRLEIQYDTSKFFLIPPEFSNCTNEEIRLLAKGATFEQAIGMHGTFDKGMVAYGYAFKLADGKITVIRKENISSKTFGTRFLSIFFAFCLLYFASIAFIKYFLRMRISSGWGLFGIVLFIIFGSFFAGLISFCILGTGKGGIKTKIDILPFIDKLYFWFNSYTCVEIAFFTLGWIFLYTYAKKNGLIGSRFNKLVLE